jgi:hypothetical protein
MFQTTNHWNLIWWFSWDISMVILMAYHGNFYGDLSNKHAGFYWDFMGLFRGISWNIHGV